MELYSIMPLDADHVGEICEDIRCQYEDGVATTALFMMTLVPEGDPPVDKAGILCEKFDLFREKLESMGLKAGILVQASIGHGYPLDNMFPFRRYANLTDGEEQNVCCPYDEGFRDHFRSVMRTLALHRPSCIMVDDDFRLMFRAGHGCACEAHMAEFNRRAGTSLTREQLYEAISGSGAADADAARLTQIFADTQIDSLVGAARAMREGIDSVDPALPGLFCACGNACEGAAEVGKILAGRGNPVVLRVNNGNYTPAGARGLSLVMLRAATQAAVLRGAADYFLAETDTCPQNRYSTGAMSLHAHFTASILEGMNGAKHWITRLHAHEPRSGDVYRRVLASHRGFYEALTRVVSELSPLGCRIPLSPRPGYGFPSCPDALSASGWPHCVLERLGFPMYFSEKSGGAVFMDGDADMKFTDGELREMFRGPVFLASDTAARLNERGFSELTGVEVRPWDGANASGERLFVNGNECSAQNRVRELVPLNDSVRADSVVYHIPDGKTRVPLFPGVTVCKNPLGGTTVVFSGTPQAAFNYIEAFSFLNESRKLELAGLLRECGALPVWYPGDAEVMLRAGDLPSGELFCAAFNLGFDPIDELSLVFARVPVSIERLTSDGNRVSVAFRRAEAPGEYVLSAELRTLDPLALFVTF